MFATNVILIILSPLLLPVALSSTSVCPWNYTTISYIKRDTKGFFSSCPLLFLLRFASLLTTVPCLVVALNAAYRCSCWYYSNRILIGVLEFQIVGRVYGDKCKLLTGGSAAPLSLWGSLPVLVVSRYPIRADAKLKGTSLMKKKHRQGLRMGMYVSSDRYRFSTVSIPYVGEFKSFMFRWKKVDLATFRSEHAKSRPGNIAGSFRSVTYIKDRVDALKLKLI